MKKINSLIITLLILMSGLSAATITKPNGMGYQTTIKSVICNQNSYTITLTITHNGCGGPNCKELSHLSIQATPGSYSNVSVSNVIGTLIYDTIIMGPNLGQDPFQGFKIDGTSGIGSGQSGSFDVVYTLTSLQSQMVSTKAGTSGNIATFTIQDFEWVMNSNSTACQNNDLDGDGCFNQDDSYPDDSTKCYDQIKTGTLAFEDLWPSKGDYDFNDLVINYNFKTSLNSNSKVADITVRFVVIAFGAGYKNGFGFQLPTTIPQSSLTTNWTSGFESGQSKPTMIMFDNVYSVMVHPGQGIGVNTDPLAPKVDYDTIQFKIFVTPNTYTIAQLGINSFNPFIFQNGVRSHEIHLANYPPTDKANMELFGTFEDASNPSQSKWYVTKNNIPWVIDIPVTFDYPKEKVSIIDAYNKFVDWATSGGVSWSDWYLNLTGYRNSEKIY